MKRTNHLVIFILATLSISICAPPVKSQTLLLKGDRIPKDLVISVILGGTIQFAPAYQLTITSDGKVFYEERSAGLPLARPSAALLNLKPGQAGKQEPPHQPKLRDRLSREQIKRIVREFENSGFFEMNEYYHGDPSLKEITCVNHAQTKGLSISAGGKTRRVSFFLGCSYGEKPPLKSFLSLFDKIGEELKGVKKEKIKGFTAN